MSPANGVWCHIRLVASRCAIGWLLGMSVLAGNPTPAVAQMPAGDVPASPAENPPAEVRWWKGNLHTHSLWSDGNDFPEMIARWYADHGYHFLALTDHNILSRGEKWMAQEAIEKRGGPTVLPKYFAAFGAEWVAQRHNAQGQAEIRLRGLAEFRGRLERPGEFLLLEGEEISDSVSRLPLHLNATNLREVLLPVGGSTMREALRNNLRAAQLQAQANGQPILVHLNHPNFGWALTAEDIAAVPEERFVEVFNGHPSVNQLGDAQRASVEAIWDIANSLRLEKLETAPLFGLGTDDSHNYHGEAGARPGRAWVMVRAAALEPAALIRAMYAGDFYASSGVELRAVEFDSHTRVLQLDIEPREGVTYRTRFIGTRRGFSAASEPRVDAEGKPLATTRKYVANLGETFATVDGVAPQYQLTGDELYVRAVVTASAPHPDPSYADQFEQAWTQPVGWSVRGQ